MNDDIKSAPHGAGRQLYTWAAAVASLVVFAGFARTYYLKSGFGTPELPPLRHVHGLVMTLWFALFVLQTQLVRVRRTSLHRRVGVAGAALSVLVLVVGVTTAIAGARRGASPGPPPLVFLGVPLGDMVVFAGLAGAGLYFRRRSAIHKRLMLLSTLSMLSAAFGRIPLEFIRAANPPVMAFGLTDLFVLACVAYDTWMHRRLHPAFGWGALLVVASHPLRLMLASTPTWVRFATWLVG
jgi:hypothetical protein